MSSIRDFAIGSVLTAPSPATSGTTLVLNSGEGNLMPTTLPFYLTVAPAGVIPSRSNAEKVKVTARSTDTLTIVRAQGETTAQSIATGWIVVNSIYTDDLFTSSMVLDEALAGTVNGTNTVFTTSTGFTAITVNKNGVTLHLGDDYTITGSNQITMVTAPATGTKLTASYITGSQVMIAGSNSIIAKEGVTESPDGSRTTFTCARAYIGGTLQVYVNGLAQGQSYITETNPGAGTFTLDTAPLTGDNISVSYMYAASTTGNADTVDGYHANATPTAGQIPVLDGSALLPTSTMKVFMPDYANQSSTNVFSSGTSYTASATGFIYVLYSSYSTAGAITNFIAVNSKAVMSGYQEAKAPSGAWVASASGTFPIAAGDVVTVGTGTVITKVGYFVPGRWV